MGGKAKPKKHTAAELAAKAKAANESVGGGKAGIQERDKNAKLTTECLEPGCQGVKLTSMTVCKTHWSNKHCTCRRAPDPETGYCECFEGWVSSDADGNYGYRGDCGFRDIPSPGGMYVPDLGFWEMEDYFDPNYYDDEE